MSASLLPLRRDREEQEVESENKINTDKNQQQIEEQDDEVDTDDDENEELLSEEQKAKRKLRQEKNNNKKKNDDDEKTDDDETEEDKKNFFRKNNGDDDLGNEDDDDNNEMIKRMREQEAKHENETQQQQQKLSKNQIESLLKILSVLKFPDETPSFALKVRFALMKQDDPKMKEQKSSLLDAVTTFEMETALTSSYSKQTSTSSSRQGQAKEEEETSLLNMTRDQILSKLLLNSSSTNNNNLVAPLQNSYLLSWSETEPATSSKFCSSSNNLFATTYFKTNFGPCSTEELVNWCKKGFFEKKQAFVLNINDDNGNSERRCWFKIPRKTSDNPFA